MWKTKENQNKYFKINDNLPLVVSYWKKIYMIIMMMTECKSINQNNDNYKNMS